MQREGAYHNPAVSTISGAGAVRLGVIYCCLYIYKKHVRETSRYRSYDRLLPSPPGFQGLLYDVGEDSSF